MLLLTISFFFFAIDLLTPCFGAAATLERTIAKNPQTVDFCKLVSAPEKYESRVVRTVATYTESFEGSGLSRGDCPAAKNIRETVWGRLAAADIEFDCRKLTFIECVQLPQKLRQDLQGNPIDGASVEVQVVGWIEVLSPRRTPAGFNEAPVRFHIQWVESKTNPKKQT